MAFIGSFQSFCLSFHGNAYLLPLARESSTAAVVLNSWVCGDHLADTLLPGSRCRCAGERPASPGRGAAREPTAALLEHSAELPPPDPAVWRTSGGLGRALGRSHGSGVCPHRACPGSRLAVLRVPARTRPAGHLRRARPPSSSGLMAMSRQDLGMPSDAQIRCVCGNVTKVSLMVVRNKERKELAARVSSRM